MTRLVIDTDPGVDDAQAIMLAFAHPETKVEALTVVAGNVGLDRTVANACTILDVLDVSPAQTPVFPGCGRALLGRRVDATSHGSDGLGDSHYPPSMRPVETEHASLALARLANESPGALTLVAIGPLTNVALAISLDPELPRMYKRLVVMGGAVRATGNMNSPSTEFNVSSDPEAAAIVLENWPGLSLVPWETTMRYLVNLERLDELASGGSPRSRFFRKITEQRPRRVREHFGVSGIFTADPLAMAVTVEPKIVTRSERHRVTVELSGKHTRGQTTVDWFDFSGEPPNVEVILELDEDRFWELLKAAVA
ncbi:MAG: nucleoside hydrolase [Candidatus Rokuibacteriota bacterium]